ncbi:MAG: S41 family peptidase [Bauldia sp.]|nr:S41 family peptidase [Bauldia sp.]
MMRKAPLLLVGVLVGAFAVFGVTQQAGLAGGQAVAQEDDTYRALNLFGEVFERIRGDYVDEVTASELIEAAISGMVDSLDPHSSYLNPDAFTAMQVQTSGEFGGLGIRVEMLNGKVHVVSPIRNTPAEAAGLITGDFIIAIDGQVVEGNLDLEQAIDLMRGRPGTEVTLVVERSTLAEPFEVVIERAIIRLETVISRIEDDVAYILLTQFSERTAREMEAAITAIEEELGDDLKGVILDLRGNPGGLLESSIAVADAFLEAGEILSTRGRNPQDTARRTATPGDIIEGLPLVVLINGGSASASEIVAGALQDQARATLVGTRSFGKGSVQTIFSLGPGDGGLRITTSRYYTPSGRSIQASGIAPDIVIFNELPPDLAEQAVDVPLQGEAALPGHLIGEEEENRITPQETYVPRNAEEDQQLIYALRLLRGEEQHAAFPPDPDLGVPE